MIIFFFLAIFVHLSASHSADSDLSDWQRTMETQLRTLQKTLDKYVKMNGQLLEENQQLKTRVDDIERKNNNMMFKVKNLEKVIDDLKISHAQCRKDFDKLSESTASISGANGVSRNHQEVQNETESIVSRLDSYALDKYGQKRRGIYHHFQNSKTAMSSILFYCEPDWSFFYTTLHHEKNEDKQQ